MKIQKVKGIISALMIGLFFCSQIVFAAEPTIKVLGDVAASGSAEMKGAFNRWMPVSGKAFPVVDGTNLRSADGMMSLIFRDAARMEVGKNSDVVVAGSKGRYSITLNKGRIAFSVPKEVSFSVITPTSTVFTQSAPQMIQPVSLTSQENIMGVVSYDGKGTKVIAVNGTLAVKSGAGVKMETVSAGNAIYIARDDNGSVKTTQLAGGTEAGGETDNTGAYAAGVLAAGEIGLFFLVNSLYQSVSPSRP